MKEKAAIIELCIVIVLLVVIICSLFRFTYFDGQPGECISVSLFGRFELQTVDKVVIASNGKEWTITDSNLIEQICNETRVAERINLCTESSKRIDLYSGDRLVRSMKWSGCCDTVEVYEPSITHWLIAPLGDKAEGGYVELSDDLRAQLNAVMKG